MQIKEFILPVGGGKSYTQEINEFLQKVNVLALEQQFTEFEGHPCWALLVKYRQSRDAKMQKGERVDYKKSLSAADFAVFELLRNKRRELADGEGVPVYRVFSNAQLAEIAVRRMQSRGELAGIKGVSEETAEKYGEILVVVPGPDAQKKE